MFVVFVGYSNNTITMAGPVCDAAAVCITH